jgi:hypothetical protein
MLQPDGGPDGRVMDPVAATKCSDEGGTCVASASDCDGVIIPQSMARVLGGTACFDW